MQKLLLSLVFFTALNASARAQMRLQWHWPAFPAAEVTVTATLQLSDGLALSDTLSLQFFEHPVQYIRLRQGRLKQHLPFRQKARALHIDLNDIRLLQRSAVEIQYRINFKDSILQPYLHQDSNLLVLSPFNLGRKATGPVGLWYPAPAAQPLRVQSDVRLPMGWEMIAPGVEQFTVQGEKYQGAFRQMEEARLSEQYFLAVGKFDEGMEPKDLDKSLELSQIAEEQMLLAQTQMQLKDLRDFLRKQNKRRLNDSLMGQLVGTVPKATHPLLGPSHPWVGASPEQYYKEYAALRHLYSDTLQAQLLFWDLVARNQSREAQGELLDSLFWQSGKPLPLTRVLFVRRYQAGLPRQLPDEARAAAGQLVQHIEKGGVIPQCTLRTRYKKSEQQFWILYRLEPPVAVPFAYRIYLRDSVLTGTAILRKTADTLRLPAPQAPQNISLHWWNAPVQATVHKPDFYWLYALQEAAAAGEKRQALKELLSTQNLNLLATVMGIALDSSTPSLQMMAIQNYPRLHASGKARFATTLQELAEQSANPTLRAMAQEVLNEVEK